MDVRQQVSASGVIGILNDMPYPYMVEWFSSATGRPLFEKLLVTASTSEEGWGPDRHALVVEDGTHVDEIRFARFLGYYTDPPYFTEYVGSPYPPRCFFLIPPDVYRASYTISQMCADPTTSCTGRGAEERCSGALSKDMT